MQFHMDHPIQTHNKTLKHDSTVHANSLQ